MALEAKTGDQLYIEVQYKYCAICKRNYWFFSENLFLVVNNAYIYVKQETHYWIKSIQYL